MKIKLDGVMETLLITLNFKAKDCSSTNPILNDKKAQEICSKIDYDFSKFDKAWMSYYGTLSRAYIMDEEIKKFIKNFGRFWYCYKSTSSLGCMRCIYN